MSDILRYKKLDGTYVKICRENLMYEGELLENDSLNDALTPGFYRIAKLCKNIPSSDFIYGNLLVIRGGTYDTYAQVLFPSSTSNTTKIAIRYGVISKISSTPWRYLTTTTS